MVSTLVIALIFLVPGLGLRYWINRRKFYRRSATGAEGFSSYEKSVAVRFLERVGKWIAYAMIIIGILGVAVYWSEKKDIEKKAKTTELQKPS
ncbi:molybdenum ABC transporter permease [Sphingobacterium sp.]|uniref:molybdenum ABC transporter permease n=1 Tax=Sphingobacterium sp. TaxID=341027 RepID=UPI00289B1E4B|nr:molybdenum ABC transporter permease [Sphingobacterium sp.]